MVDGARGRIKVGVAGEDAVLAIDNGRDEVALRVDGRDTLAVDDGTGFRREVVPDFRQGFFFVFWSPSAAPFSFASASRFFFASSRFFFLASSAFRRFAAELSFLKRSLVFFRNGTWL